eukprot:TRINITY_DN24329_c0_g1_i1.p1 TRINITY_DN24329_c0_g1~~TRINITY_DN24329_c0_g1_i1.p1  ORF type:complete len:305 (+),score=25.83 TRINITY_DN24329_c0_g1_i1:57-971(+)
MTRRWRVYHIVLTMASCGVSGMLMHSLWTLIQSAVFQKANSTSVSDDTLEGLFKLDEAWLHVRWVTTIVQSVCAGIGTFLGVAFADRLTCRVPLLQDQVIARVITVLCLLSLGTFVGTLLGSVACLAFVTRKLSTIIFDIVLDCLPTCVQWIFRLLWSRLMAGVLLCVGSLLFDVGFYLVFPVLLFTFVTYWLLGNVTDVASASDSDNDDVLDNHKDSDYRCKQESVDEDRYPVSSQDGKLSQRMPAEPQRSQELSFGEVSGARSRRVERKSEGSRRRIETPPPRHTHSLCRSDEDLVRQFATS